MNDSSLSHTRYNCAYHIVFIPKYRREIMYGETKKAIGEILRKLCEMKGVTLIEGNVCKDHVHMYVSVPPKLAVSEFMGYLKGKSALMLFDKFPQYASHGRRNFWARGYYVTTIGNVNEAAIREYIKEQEEDDKWEGKPLEEAAGMICPQNPPLGGASNLPWRG